ncbi:ComEC/Rec2 family competence protein [Neobacillus sp. Marseille-QA0830]
MRTLLIFLPLVFLFSFVVTAETIHSGNVENIKLNLKDHEMAVTFIGLTAGEATLIQGPEGKAILVDMGGQDTEKELNRWLKLYDVKTIHTLILTKESKHLSAHRLNDLIANYKIGEIITFPGAYPNVVSEIDEQYQVSVHAWEQGKKSEILPELMSEVQFAGSGQNEGLDLTLDFFGNRLFFLSSFSSRAEETLMSRDLGNITVLKIPNLDKESSLSEELITYLNPEISILFTSEDLSDTDMISSLRQTWSEVYSTKRHGTVTLKFSESKYEIFTIPREKEAN